MAKTKIFGHITGSGAQNEENRAKSLSYSKYLLIEHGSELCAHFPTKSPSKNVGGPFFTSKVGKWHILSMAFMKRHRPKIFYKNMYLYRHKITANLHCPTSNP